MTDVVQPPATVLEENKDAKNEPNKEVFDVVKILELVQLEEKIEMETKKHENDDEIKKTRKRYKKLVKDIESFHAGKLDNREKIDAIFEKFQKLIKECRTLNEKFVTLKVSHKLSIGEKAKVSEDHTKLINVNNALENYCKDLQRQNQDLVEVHKKLQQEEKEIRTKLAEEFQKQINDISTNLEKQVLENLQKSKENEILKEKLKEVQEKYEARETFFSEEIKNREKQLGDHNERVMEKFKEIENEALNIETYKEKHDKIKGVETEWNNILQMYLDKATQFQNSMMKANEFFTKIKKEMEKMSLKIQNLDNNNLELQRKCEKTDVAIVEFIDDNIKLTTELSKEKTQLHGLESIVKKLQDDIAEKTKKINELKNKAK
jgi:chromosome segregation ATPase